MGIQFSSANMLIPAAIDTTNSFGTQLNAMESNSMHLGKWRNQISQKIMPHFYNRLTENTSTHSLNNPRKLGFSFSGNNSRTINTVFSKDIYNNYLDNKALKFSFTSEISEMDAFTLNQYSNSYVFNNSSGNFIEKYGLPGVLVKQERYTPGYTFTNGKNRMSVQAILVNQRFLDNDITTNIIENSWQNNYLSNDNSNIQHRGTGYSLNYYRHITKNSYVTFDYNSRIKMDEFGSFGKYYADKGNFDIPKSISVTLGLPLFENNSIEFITENINYSQVDVNSHSGYSYYFRNFVNTFLRPSKVNLKDLTVYSIRFNQKASDNFNWNIDVTSRQQADTNSVIYNNALDRDTANISYKLGLTYNSSVGDFKLFASYAKKPILIGSTDFGRFVSTNLNQQIEGVASWSFAF